MKLCTLVAYEKLGVNTATAIYFPGDRENGGVFKHAAMMATVASLKAAKTVKDEALAKQLAELAYFMIDRTLPYTTMDDPFRLKGNPRFCNQTFSTPCFFSSLVCRLMSCLSSLVEHLAYPCVIEIPLSFFVTKIA